MARRNRGLTDRGTRKRFPRSRKVSKLTPSPYKYSPASQAVAARVYGPQTTSTNPGSGGGGGNPRTPLYPGYLTPAQIRAAALADANLQYGMDAREFRLLRDEELKRAEKHARAIQGFTTAAAQMMQGAGPAVQGAYQSAAKDQSMFAKGFSDATAHVASQTADTANQRLAALGNTGTPVQGDTGAADVLYGLGGYIPATTMEREGAGFAAQAAAYPQATLGEGAVAFRGALQAGDDAAKGYDARLKSLAIQKGMTVSQLIRQARREQAGLLGQDRNARIQQARFDAQQAAQGRRDEYQMGYLQLQSAKTANSQAQAWTRINGYQSGPDGRVLKGPDGKPVPTAATVQAAQTQARLQRGQDATITGTDPLTGKPTYTAGNDAAKAAAKVKADKIKAAAKVKAAKKARAVAGKTAVANRTKDMSKARVAAAKLAQDAAGDLVLNPAWKPGSLTRKKYLDYNGNQTNDAKAAARKADYNVVFNRIWSVIDAPGLAARYNLDLSVLRKTVNDIMRLAGFKRRVKKKPKPTKPYTPPNSSAAH